MKTRVGPLLRDEAARFTLRFACDDCAHFDAARTACAHGYPPGPRRAELESEEIVFCKEFELGGG
jgi:hypothetical protein